MQCPRCGFENMPGMTACLRCRTVLVTTGAIDVHPPRAGAFKPLRRVGYTLHRWWGGTAGEGRFAFLQKRFGDWPIGLLEFFALLASIVPGLGHVMAGRGRAGARFWLVWAGLLAVGLYLYGMKVGIGLLGAAMAVHAWMMIDAGNVRKLFPSIQGRFLIVVLLTFVLMSALYNNARKFGGRWVQGAYSSVDVLEQGIRRLDFLLVNPNYYRDAGPQRGDVALVDLGHRTNRGYTASEPAIVVHGEPILGQILALPGDGVELSSGTLRVRTPDGRVLQSPAPTVFATMEIGFMLMPGKYFFASEYTQQDVRIGGMKLIEWIAIVEKGDMLGRAFMVYNPPWRAHRLAPQPLEIGGRSTP